MDKNHIKSLYKFITFTTCITGTWQQSNTNNYLNVHRIPFNNTMEFVFPYEVKNKKEFDYYYNLLNDLVGKI